MALSWAYAVPGFFCFNWRESVSTRLASPEAGAGAAGGFAADFWEDFLCVVWALDVASGFVAG
jgi:hypothetical protein